MAVYLYTPANPPYRYFFCKGDAATASTALFHPLNILLHPVRAVAFHLVGNMAAYAQRKRRRSVSEISLHSLNVVPGTDGGNSERMPLWHNKDKENAYYPAWALAPRPGAFYQQGTGQRAASFGSVSKPTQTDRRWPVRAPCSLG